VKTRNLILLLTSLLLCEAGFSQWVQTDGPYGSSGVSGILENKGKIIALSNCGLHYCDSIPGRWTFQAPLDFGEYSQKGDTLYFGGYYSGIKYLDLSDPGTSAVNAGLGSATILAIAQSDTCLYAGSDNGGFYKSIGFSPLWANYNKGLPADTFYIPPKFGGGYVITYKVFSVATNKDKIYCGTKYGVYKSDPGTIAWTPANNGMPRASTDLLKSIEDTLYTASNNKLYQSSDGNSWVEFLSAASPITSINKFNDIFYVTALSNEIYTSADNGKTWLNFTPGLDGLNIFTLENIDSVLLCGTSNGVYYLKNDVWIPDNDGLICSLIRSLSSAHNSLVANDYTSVYISGNHLDWDNISPDVSKQSFGSLACIEDTVFLSYTSYEWEHRIMYYPVKNKTWHDMAGNVPYNGDDPYSLYTENKTLYAWEDDKMYFTDNLGSSWTDISIPEQFCNMFYGFTIFNSTRFANACGNSELIKYTNNNWELSNSGLPSGWEVFGLAVTTDAIYAYVNGYGIFVSRDSGNTWTFAGTGLNPEKGFRSSAYKGISLFITTADGVFFTDNYGHDWHPFNEGLLNKNTSGIELVNDTLFVGTHGNGIWKRDINSIPLAVNEPRQNATELTVYPNPATGTVKFLTGGNEPGNVKITDTSGKQVLSTNAFPSESVDVSGLPEGFYILYFTTKSKTCENKLIIQR